MTRHRKYPDAISNYFDELLDGIGHRGSSFCDIDAITHDMATGRFLVQEFKNEGESVPSGQRMALRALSGLQGVTVWLAIRQNDGRIGFAEFPESIVRSISVQDYKAKYQRWWANSPHADPSQHYQVSVEMDEFSQLFDPPFQSGEFH
jgi:hypothetical protein